MTRSFIAFVISAVFFHTTGATIAAEAKPSTKPSKKVALFQLRGSLVEAPRGLTFAFTGEHRGTVHELLQRLGKAAKDDEVAGVAIILDEPSFGWAHVQELRAAIGRLRAVHKTVHCHLTSAGEGAYMVAAACDRISLVPSGSIDLTGLAAEGLYFKGLLDKLGIVADIEHCGAYKGSGEPYTQTGPSKESQEQMQALFGDLYEQMVEVIAKSRDLPAERVRELIDRGPFTARQAAAARLVDELSYRNEFLKDVQKRLDGAQLAGNYGRQKGPELDLGSPLGFFKLLRDMMEPTKRKAKNVVALVYVDGMIWTGASEESFFDEFIAGSTTLRRALIEAAEDDGVKAVVLRIDSPGGSALASDIIHQATQIVRKAGKPVIASMGNKAASGGYYVASGADAIFAEPGTITGSIGVVGGKLALGGLFDKIGITTHTYRFGRRADMFNFTRPFDEQERQAVREQMNETYEQFKRCVTSGRGDRLKGDIEQLAGGRVYTGRQALAKGLVDQLGGLDEAIRHAANQAKVADYQVRVMPKPKTLFDFIRDAFGLEDEDEEASVRGDTRLSLWHQLDPSLRASVLGIGQLAPDAARAVARMLLRIELLRRETVLTVTPDEWLLH
jgi:protease-4